MTTTIANPVTSPLAVIFTVNDGLITRALDGMSEDELWQRPSERGNPMFWLLGHIVHTRGGLLRMIGDDFRTGWGDAFHRGAALRPRAQYPSFAEIESVRAQVRERLLPRLAAMTEAELAREGVGVPLPAAKTVAERIGFLAMHDSYHVGQLAILRKMLGHSGIAG
jgi:uncharacterized damage-inducible protein DinB